MKDAESLEKENQELRARLTEAEELLAAIKSGSVDAVVTEDSRVLSSEGAGYSYMVLVETMGDGAATLTPSGTILSCNGRLARMLGLPETAVPGKSIFDFFPAEDKERLAGLMSRTDGAGEHAEFNLKNTSGEALPVLVSCSSLRPKVDATGIIITDLTAQKKAAADLKTSEAKYRALFDRAFDAFLLLELTPDGIPVIVDANQSALNMHGFSREEIIGKPLTFLDAGDTPERLIRRRIEHILSSSGAIFEARHRRKDGKPVDLEVSVQPVDIGGRTLQLDISRDITERKKAEGVLRSAKLALEEAQRIASVGSWYYDVASDKPSWSPEMFRIFGLEPGDGEPGWEEHRKLIDPADWPALDAAVARAASEGEPYEIMFRIIVPGSEPRWAVTIGKAEKDASGRIVRLFGTTQDITEHKRAETKVREALEKQGVLNDMLQRSIERTPLSHKLHGHLKSILALPWLAVMPKGAVFLADRSGKELELLCYEGLNPDLVQKCASVHSGSCICGRVLETGKAMETHAVGPEHKVTYEGIAPHGHYCAPITASDRVLGVLNLYLKEGVVLDAAQRDFLRSATDIMAENILHAQTEEKFSQSQKMESVGRLAGGVAHDFNNLLTAINGYAGLLLRGLPVSDPKREDVKEIIAAAERAAALTRQLLAFSRKQLLSPRPLDLNAAIGGMVNMLSRLIGEDIKLETKLEKRPCTVMVDPGQIDQIVINLAVNARDAMQAGGRLLLETELLTDAGSVFLRYPDFPRGPVVRLSVTDNGIGMPKEVVANVFEPFFTTKEKGHGTGLGLAMVFGIVKQSGGEIEVESEQGEGTTFSIFLPGLIRGPGEEDQESAGKIAKGSETILLVEDEESLRRMGARLLRGAGYTVITASDGDEALEAIERHGRPVDLLMTDVVMPGMSGRDLAKEFERRELAGRTLYMSGYTDDAIVKHGVLKDGIAFIYKPFTVEALTTKIRAILDGPAGQARA